MPEWFENEDLWRAAYEFIFSDERRAAALHDVDAILTLADVGAGRDVLDLCCGPGRHSVPLAKRGLRVTGVDGSDYLLARARDYAREAHVGIEWIKSDMREFARAGSFDLVLNLFTSFGYFEAAEDNQRVLDNCFASLRPGGALVVDVMGREVLARVFQETVSQALPDGRLLMQRTQIKAAWSRAETDWLFIRGDQLEDRFLVRHWVYSGSDLAAMLRASGFTRVRLFGGFNGSEYATSANRLVALARKP